MSIKMNFNIQVEIEEAEIKSGNLFFFFQSNGLPTIRRAKEKENWNNIINSKTGKNPYMKVINIEGVLLSPREIFKI